ncbi:MAG: hypothetical protein CM15mP34_2450 [Gammaproteobacteria bacterium]|nr:MAG: hypothetical protein CM15mP34_2450 [Gammaproteobacteria bacterium]
MLNKKKKKMGKKEQRKHLAQLRIMPTTAKTDIEVAQRAMAMVGMEPLSSFTESTDEALVMNTVFLKILLKIIYQCITGTLLSVRYS